MLTAHLPSLPDAIAPDGSEVRLLVRSRDGSMAHFTLPAGQTSIAVASRTLDEMWYFIEGQGEMWRRSERSGEEKYVEVGAGTAISIPNHTQFQFRSLSAEPLIAIGVTMPEWPGIGDMSGDGEVYFVEGPWAPTVESASER